MQRLLILVGVLGVLLVGVSVAAASTAHSEQDIIGHSEGNHRLDCTVIRPWADNESPSGTFPVIVWANGWGGNNNAGETTTLGYKPGLIEWAQDGPYIVVAANAWSPRDVDVWACLGWLADQNMTSGSEYEGHVNTNKIGLAGHSQGGGAVIKAGHGGDTGFAITAVVGMTPYGPNWNKAGNQNGPVMLLGGSADTVTPVASFLAVWDALQGNGPGGLLAVLDGGTHNSEAWGSSNASAPFENFGQFQDVTELWWQYHLNGDAAAAVQMQAILDAAPWTTDYAMSLP
jgi:dienelactone hydrolase